METLYFKDFVYEFKGITHTREISRGVILNEHNEIAIIKLYSNDSFGIRDCYELPGGGIKENESPVEAFKREAIEEVGYEIEVLDQLADVIDYYNHIQRENHQHYFIGKVVKFVGNNLEPYEAKMFANISFVTIDDAIDKFTNEMRGGVGQLVQQRELPILKLAKAYIESMKKD